MTVVFLDFDGVTHPWNPRESGQEKFCFLPRIESVMADFPRIQVVVCSDWRTKVAWSEILSVFSEDFRPRVVGATPVVPSAERWLAGHRYVEAMRYLEERALDSEAWVALDDYATNWPAGDARVVVCPDEFGDREEAILREALSNSREH